MDIEKDSLKHGEYKVKITQLEGTNIISTETVVKPLLQEELADGWLQIQPKRKDNIQANLIVTALRTKMMNVITDRIHRILTTKIILRNLKKGFLEFKNLLMSPAYI
jgi:glycerol-3-phosphate dehydrogenase